MHKRDKKYRRHAAIVGCLALMAGLLAFGAPVVQAQVNVTNYVQSFHPDADFPDGNKSILADQFDGQDSVAHLTAVAEDDADRVAWYRCDSGTTTAQSFRDPDVCTLLGSDTSGVQPGAENADEAYDIFHPISAAEENDGPWAVLVQACTGAPNDTLSNCSTDIEDPITFDDSATAGRQPTGEIDGLCFDPGTGGARDTDCDQNAEFDDDGHGSDVEPGGFFVQFTTSDEVANDQAIACIDLNADGNQEPENANECADAEAISTEVDHKVWRTTQPITTYDDAAETTAADGFDLFIMHDPNNNELAEAGELVFDEHYKGLVEEAVEAVALTFIQDPDTVDTVPAGADCEDPDTDATHQVSPPGAFETEPLEGCVFDQFNNRLAGEEVTFELTGVGEIETCDDGSGVLHDHDDNGLNEHCHDTGAADAGSFDITISNDDDGNNADTDNDTGRTTVTFCQDDEAQGPSAGTEANPLPEHGCADEDSVQAVKDWVALAEEVTLVFDDGDGDCLGPNNLNNNGGDQDTLIFCVTDRDGNPVPGERVRWRIIQGADDETNTQFVETETVTDENGQARAVIQANTRGTDNIMACTEGADDVFGTGDDLCDSVQKNVVSDAGDGDGDGEQIPCTISGTDGPDNLTGTEGDDVICGFGGDDTLSGLGGDDIIAGGFGSDTMNGGAGQDTLEGDEVNSCLEGGEACGGPGSDTGNGGDGKDTIRGDDGNDVLNGGDKNDLLIGGGGDDELNGENGWDTIRGNVGDDTLRGARGRDILQGGVGNDTARGGSNDDTIRGFTGSDRLIGHAGDDIIKGGTGNDTLRGGRGDDILNGGAGRDSCRGGPGSDVLRRCETR